LVEVEFNAVKFWSVEDELMRRLAKVPRPVEVRFPPEAPVKMRLVEEAVVEKRLVEVAFEVVEFSITKLLITDGVAVVEEAKMVRSWRAVVVPLVVVP